VALTGLSVLCVSEAAMLNVSMLQCMKVRQCQRRSISILKSCVSPDGAFSVPSSTRDLHDRVATIPEDSLVKDRWMTSARAHTSNSFILSLRSTLGRVTNRDRAR
jgi:hypothetical protein